MRALLLAVLVASVAGCKSSVDPDKGRFSCATTDDCGSGYECIKQFAGGGRCFVTGTCNKSETCDGTDENCDGRIDETFPRLDGGCTTTKPGLCAAGHLACVTGAEVCLQTVLPSAELCNGLDDNCDGHSDETFDLTSDSRNCGACATVCDAGTSCSTSSCLENNCADGVDNDLNGLADCDDPICYGQECTTVVLPPQRCGLLTAPDGGPDGGTDAGGDGGADGGADGGRDGGSDGGLRGCFAPETDCANGLDDDGDGLSDCADPDCDARLCVTGTLCTARMCPGPG